MKRAAPPEPVRLYYLAPYTAGVCESPELFTWKDACEALDYLKALHPEAEYEIREFESV